MLIKTILNRAIKSDRKANILLFFCDGWFDRQLALTGHNFYGNMDGTLFKWECPDREDNITFLPKSLKTNLTDMFFDLIITNDRPYQNAKAQEFSKTFSIPIVHVDHGAVPTTLSENDLQKLLSAPVRADFLVCTNQSEQQWPGDAKYIPYCYPKIEQEEKDIEILISGRFTQEEYGIIKSITSQFENVLVIGPNPGLSEPVELERYYEIFARTKIFVNLSTDTNLNNGIMTACRAGCAVVSNRTPVINAVDNGGLKVCADIPQIIRTVKELQNNPKTMRECVAGASSINYGSTEEDFVEKWNEIIESVRYKVVTR
jgi:glycosyltransferase involved in cell wall biosynthesis